MFRYLFCVLLAPVAVLAVSPAQAAAPNTAEQTKVSARGVDFSDARQTKAFYGELDKAAHKVCDVPATNDLSVKADSADCRDTALDDAVRRLDKPSLTKLRQMDAGAAPQVADVRPPR